MWADERKVVQMLCVVTVQRRGALVLVEFVHDDVELVFTVDAARQLGDALQRASFNVREVSEIWVEVDELLEADATHRHDGG